MAKAKNKVINGDYENADIIVTNKKLYIEIGGERRIALDDTTIKRAEPLDEKQYKSILDTVVKAEGIAIPLCILFPPSIVGVIGIGCGSAVAGFLLGKNIYRAKVAIEFKSGKYSVLDIDKERFRILCRDKK